jgi:hypothetical protein
MSLDLANHLTAYSSAATYAYDADGLRMSNTDWATASQFHWDVVNGLPVVIEAGSTAYGVSAPFLIPEKLGRGAIRRSTESRATP